MNEIISILITAAKKQGLSILLSLGFALLFFQQLNEVRRGQRECMAQYLEYLRRDHEMMVRSLENNTVVMQAIEGRGRSK